MLIGLVSGLCQCRQHWFDIFVELVKLTCRRIVFNSKNVHMQMSCKTFSPCKRIKPRSLFDVRCLLHNLFFFFFFGVFSLSFAMADWFSLVCAWLRTGTFCVPPPPPPWCKICGGFSGFLDFKVSRITPSHPAVAEISELCFFFFWILKFLCSPFPQLQKFLDFVSFSGFRSFRITKLGCRVQ